MMLTRSARRVLAALAFALAVAVATLSLHAPANADTSRRATGTFSGKVVNQANNKPVKGVTVRVFRINSNTLLGSDVTDSLGHYFIGGLDPVQDEELDVRVNGRAVHFEAGWVGCNNRVVQSEGASCSHGQGRQTPFFLQHL